MRRPFLISWIAVATALALVACGGPGESGFTAGAGPPTSAAEVAESIGRPTAEMANQTEELIADQLKTAYRSPECVPARSLVGSGEFKFSCTALSREDGERTEMDVTVHGSDSGEPGQTVIDLHSCVEPVNERGELLPRGC